MEIQEITYNNKIGNSQTLNFKKKNLKHLSIQLKLYIISFSRLFIPI